MLDPFAYRMAEPHTKKRHAHVVDHFERIGFPVRINSIQETAQLLNSMQENRFDLYMSEMGGLTDREHAALVGYCQDLMMFQRLFFPRMFFPRKPLVLPLSVLMSVMCLHRKMLGINPEFETVLELGPGCGYLSLSLLYHDSLASYCQVEACESFYILQSLLNSHIFSVAFTEHVFEERSEKLWTPEGQVETPPVVNSPTLPPLCEHFPWWKIGNLATRTFDIVTSNANLLEFQPEALDQYLGLIADVLAPDGALLAQCLGSHVHGTPEQLFAKAEEAGLTLITDFRVNDIHNALWVRKDHASFAHQALTDQVFHTKPEGRTVYTMEQIVNAVKAAL